MPNIDLQAVIEQLAIKIAADLKNINQAETVANVTMSHVPAACTKVNFEPVNQLEQTSLKALIGWVAANCNVSETQIAARLTQSFGADTIDGIDRSDFDEAIAWLVDFKPVLN